MRAAPGRARPAPPSPRMCTWGCTAPSGGETKWRRPLVVGQTKWRRPLAVRADKMAAPPGGGGGETKWRQSPREP